ncbi:MAG: prfA [Acidimicrobiia bacterium]|nr:prfA [Acidimicrobiia bacterium]
MAVEGRLADPSVLADQSRYRVESKRYSELTPVIAAYRVWRARLDDLAVAKELAAESEGAERDDMRRQVAAYEAEVEGLSEELKALLLPRDPNDGKNVIVEIRGAEGGEEANLFARDLFDMYQAYAGRQGWKLEVMSSDPSDMGGFNQVVFMVVGDGAWSHLKYEGGPHRVQRVPVTESQGRVHTSSATVLVLPEAEEVDVDIDPGDLQIDVYRASGPGGQSVNTTDSAVRITHLPTGVAVAMQDERSQLQNRAKAMTVLRSRLLKLEQDRHNAEMAVERKAQVGGGGRSEKIRTYNYKENRLTDHRIGLTIYKLQNVLSGELEEVVDALRGDERARQLSNEDD